MNKSYGENKKILELTKSAYKLADVLSSTREMKEIFLIEKVMTYEQWSTSVRKLFQTIDMIIFSQCMIQLIKTAFYRRIDIPEDATILTESIIPSQITNAATELGLNLRNVINELDEHKLEDTNYQLCDLLSDQTFSAAIIDVSIYIVDIILSDLGLKRIDLAGIY